MVNRPFKDIRPLGPFVSNEAGTEAQSKEKHINAPVFNSMSDLPDSPMLKQYVEQQVNYTGLDEKTVINSTPVKEYMKRLGVWDKAVEMNT
mgnify:CR=1 FL=1|jgi:hypothetical protein